MPEALRQYLIQVALLPQEHQGATAGGAAVPAVLLHSAPLAVLHLLQPVLPPRLPSTLR